MTKRANPSMRDASRARLAPTFGDVVKPRLTFHHGNTEASFVFRLDYLSCLLTIASTVLVGKHHWEGWVIAAVNSILLCVIGFKTAQLGFIPANLFCIVLYAVNLKTWRKAQV